VPQTGAPAAVIERDVVYADRGRQLRLDLFRPADDRSFGRRQGWVFMHGGGWRTGGKSQFERHARHLAETLHAVTVSIEYRFAHEAPFPAPVDDVVTAVRWLQDREGTFGLDPAAIFLAGGSAGGHLAAMAAIGTDQLEGDVAGMVLFNPVLDLAEVARRSVDLAQVLETLLDGAVDEIPERYAAASPITYAGSATTPALVLHGTRDDVVAYDTSAAFVRGLQERGVAAELFTAEGAGHGSFNVSPWYEPCLDRMTAFAKSQLR